MKTEKIRKITGWLVFAVTLFVYILTLEPTTSFWDCGEFILSASNLEVNHPSGAPLYMLTGRLFSLLSFGNTGQIAFYINLMSAFFSALTVFFLFYSILLIAEKISDNEYLIIGSGIIGALSFAFTDSFWFSAVEAEVYAQSLFFMIVSLWALLKWEKDFGKAGNNRWILFVALIQGMGMGIHLLNLLVIPSLVILVGLKNGKFSLLRIIILFLTGTLLLIVVLYVLIPGFLTILSVSDLFFVNVLKLPANTGVLTGYIGLIITLLIFNTFFIRRGFEKFSIATLSVLFLITGFSVYAVNMIRSQADTPVNFGKPDNIFSLIDYLNREQYPKRPLFYGENFNSVPVGVSERKSKNLVNGKYIDIDLASKYEYLPETCGFFPRMYSTEPGHMEAYKNWVKIDGKRVKVTRPDGKNETLIIPSLADNIRFYLKYQFGHMYLRYFMWNFAGRQNDYQGRGEVTKGNWISGINFLDSQRLGSQKDLPRWLKINKARNTYYFLPLILGLTGAFFHFRRNKGGFFALFGLFLFSGIGLTLYINDVPVVPRERDYVFVGSFLVFCIWIGIAFISVASFVVKHLNRRTNMMVSVVFVLLIIASPFLLFQKNFDDHNRSKRFAARDYARNILESCPQNAILFTSGDNDTYPVLYCQEVEKVRRDVRVVIMPFLGANWYIGQLKSKKYENNGLKMVLPQQTMENGTLDVLSVNEKVDRQVEMVELLDYLKISSFARQKNDSGNVYMEIPTTNHFVTIPGRDSVQKIPVSFKEKKYIYKHEIAFWDIITSNALNRPICFVSKNEAQNFGLLNYLKIVGVVYQLTSDRNNMNHFIENPPFDAENQYDLMLKTFKYGNLNSKDVFVDFTSIYNTGIFQFKNIFNALANSYALKGETEKTAEILKTSDMLFPEDVFLYNHDDISMIEIYFNAGFKNEASVKYQKVIDFTVKNLSWYSKLNRSKRDTVIQDIYTNFSYLSGLVQTGEKLDIKSTAKAKEELTRFMEIFKREIS